MKVALVADAVEFAGAERYLEVLAEGLRDQGDRLLALLPDEGDASLAERLGRHAEITRIPGLRRLPGAAAVPRVRRALTLFQPDVVHLNLTDQGDGIASVLAAPRRRAVATLHNVLPARAAARERVSACLLRRPAAVLCVSAPVGRYVERLGGRAVVIPNGLPTAIPHPTPRVVLGLPEDAVVVGGIGRLDPQKGWDVLAAAAEQLPGVRVVVIGDGPQRGELAGTRLELPGGRPDAAELVGAFDILAMPSRFEAFGLVALEAMQAGVPVVASAVGGLADLVADSGVLVPLEDADRLAAALRDLLADPARRHALGEAGRARSRQFTPAVMVEQTRRVLARVAADAS
ncbi:MAG: glycosyltransferase family 4 protein [Frankiaceae bacterium]|nr:glycosyltransferase family 4 protein [Frankiaceae bacterium]